MMMDHARCIHPLVFGFRLASSLHFVCFIGCRRASDRHVETKAIPQHLIFPGMNFGYAKTYLLTYIRICILSLSIQICVWMKTLEITLTLMHLVSENCSRCPKNFWLRRNTTTDIHIQKPPLCVSSGSFLLFIRQDRDTSVHYSPLSTNSGFALVWR